MTSVWNRNWGKSENPQKALNLTQLAGVIFIYLIGMAAGTVAFILEICYARM